MIEWINNVWQIKKKMKQNRKYKLETVPFARARAKLGGML